MAINQGRVIDALEAICKDIDSNEFIFQFLSAYGAAKTTISRLRDGSRNVASRVGDMAVKKQVYFRPVATGTDVYACAEALKAERVIAGNDIRFVLVTDFDLLVAFDLRADESLATDIRLLDKQYAFFLPLIAGYEKAVMYSEHPADVRASEKMGQLFDLIRERNDLSKPEDIHALNVFLTRLLFCFYAEDTGIFQQDQMTKAIESTTSVTGSDLDQFFTDLFAALNLPDGSSTKAMLAAHFQKFPYVNGGLFKDDEPIPEFSTKARRILLECGSLSWAEINPDIFGSMFQAVIDQEQRGTLGQHYTSVPNILKVINPLFIDKLWNALEQARGKEKSLKELLVRLQKIRIFDPACGSGNFLIIAYKELRKIEMAVIDSLNASGSNSEMYYSGITLAQFCGIEIDDFASEVATLSLWLAEHQMNLEFKEKFGYAEAALPLKESGKILRSNSLEADWSGFLGIDNANTSNYEVYICGNPPFKGKKEQSKLQKSEILKLFSGNKHAGLLDYVCCWFKKASEFLEVAPTAEVGFVSTNSIVHGEQVAPLWGELISKGICINFAHQTFNWASSAKGTAAVHVVIIGFGKVDRPTKTIALYPNINHSPLNKVVRTLNPYLVEGPNVVISNRPKPLCDVPRLLEGITPLDNGYLSFSEEEYILAVEKEPAAKKWFKRWVTGHSFINGYSMYCLWLVGAEKDELESFEVIRESIAKVAKFREDSKSSQGFAKTPWLFRETQMPDSVLVIPKTSSERRKYVPMGFVSNSVVSSSSLMMDGDLYHLGILMSDISNVWLSAVGGRLKSDYRYSSKLVYNNFPWPQVSDDQKADIKLLTENILMLREDFPDKTLADLYDPEKMPVPLLHAHKSLDSAVQKLYRAKPFAEASEVLEHMLGLHFRISAE